MQTFKELALEKQVGYFKDKHNITKYTVPSEARITLDENCCKSKAMKLASIAETQRSLSKSGV